MNYQEAIEFLFKSLPMYQRVGKAAYKKDLTNTLKLCGVLGNPHTKFKSVHIAGTNGKGSSAHMISSMLQSAGYKVGLYISPHLKSFTERIKISGAEIPEEKVAEFVTRYKKYIEAIQPSFFEITVAMAFDYFANEDVDIAIIETGLGGRLDSTNVITPVVSLITNIGYDHQDMLGDTLEKIAVEKAGIIKNTVPVVIGEKQDDLVDLFLNIARERHSPLYFASDSYRVKSKHDNLEIIKDSQPYLVEVSPQLKGNYQNNNIPGVLSVIDRLTDLGFVISKDDMKAGLENTSDLTGLKGRWQIINNQPITICDTAHNKEGINLVLEQLNSIEHENLHIVWGMVNDKSLESILKILPKKANYYFCQANVPRALDATLLHNSAESFGLEGLVIKDVNDAIAAANENANENDLIFIGGSTFVVAEIEQL